MIPFFKAILEWMFSTKRLKAENARRERQLVAAVQSPNAPPELVEAATIYFMSKPKSDPALPKVKEGSNGPG
jgi:hypothetical protein